MTRDRAITRVQKLLRIVHTTSGATEPERASAALEVARIIIGERLELVRPPEERAVTPWQRNRATRALTCHVCGARIVRQDPCVWRRSGFAVHAAHPWCARED